MPFLRNFMFPVELPGKSGEKKCSSSQGLKGCKEGLLWSDKPIVGMPPYRVIEIMDVVGDAGHGVLSCLESGAHDQDLFE